MRQFKFENLESRRLLSTTMGTAGEPVLMPGPSTPVSNSQSLSAPQVQQILAQAISQSMNSHGVSKQAAVVVDREGTVLGALAGSGAMFPANDVAPELVLLATVRARTAAFFESTQDAFTTRTARFIIQNHFPPGVANTEGGPLYGVEFSDLLGNDILSPSLTPAISGDPGGVPLYIHGVPVGAIGVAGDGRDVAATAQLLGLTQDTIDPSADNHLYNANPHRLVYNLKEETDRDEALAQAGARGFMAPPDIRASNIFIGGLRLPFVAEPPARGKPSQAFSTLASEGSATEFGTNLSPVSSGTSAVAAGKPEVQNAVFAGIPGLIRDRANVEMSDVPGVPLAGDIAHADPQDSDNIIGSYDPASTVAADQSASSSLTLDDVTKIITQAVHQATLTRGGIRQPVGTSAKIHVVVVDAQGNVLGAFRMNDGTNFSYDVAVQKARTAAFFSDDTHAFSTRAIGFMAQRNFPPGLGSQAKGPLYLLQNALDQVNPPPTPGAMPPPSMPLTLTKPTPPGLGDGITIFPGGFPIYKNGKLVGAIGVSGDGVDQDDLIAYTGATGFQPAPNIRSDSLTASAISCFIVQKLNQIETTTPLGYDAVAQAEKSLAKNLHNTRLPYAKFPRNPGVNGH